MNPDVRRNLGSLAVYNVLRGFSVGGYQALFGFYMSSLGYAMRSVGGAASIASLVGALLAPAVGYLIDSYGSRATVAATGALLAAGLYVLYLSDAYYVLVLSYTLFMLAFYFGQPARASFLAYSVGVERLGSNVGLIASTFSAARIVGPFAAGYMAARLGFRPTFLILGILVTLGFTLFWALSREPVARRRRHASLKEGFRETYSKLFRPGPLLATVYLFIGVDRFVWALWLPLLSAHLENRGYSETVVGVLFSVQGLVQTVALPLAGRVADRLGPFVMAASSEALGALTALLLAYLPGSMAVGAGFAALGLSIAFWVPGYNILIARLAERLGEAYASANAVRGVAGIPAPYIGGYLYDVVGLAAPFTASAAALLVLGVLALTLLPARLSRGEKPYGDAWSLS